MNSMIYAIFDMGLTVQGVLSLSNHRFGMELLPIDVMIPLYTVVLQYGSQPWMSTMIDYMPFESYNRYLGGYVVYYCTYSLSRCST
jgi:hypothetical protein